MLRMGVAKCQIAKAAGVSSSVVERIWQGSRDPTPDEIREMCRKIREGWSEQTRISRIAWIPYCRGGSG